MNHIELIKNELKSFKENELIVTRSLFNELSKINEVSELAFYKAFERLLKDNKIVRVSKGIYTKPKKGKYGEVPINEKSIVDYFVHQNHGMVIGYRMYNTVKLTTQIGNKVRLYSNNLDQQTKRIENIEIERVDIEFTDENVMLIQLLEVLENFTKIEDINNAIFIEFVDERIKKYIDKRFLEIYRAKRYRKSSISFLKRILDTHCIKNNLNHYLSSTSKYNVPNLKVIHEIT